jgi:prolyl-tRNA editing enzyme YbaK/EbsC (Cys-tRNA(Pro) deacylase)
MDPAERAVRDHLERVGVEHEIVPCDPELADTAAFCAANGYEEEDSANTILVVGKPRAGGGADRGARPGGAQDAAGQGAGPLRYAACVVLATTRLDVNRTVRHRLGVRKASFADPEQTRSVTGMLIGGVSALGLPADLPVWVDGRVVDRPRIILGGGSRSCKVIGPPALLTARAGVEVVSGLAVAPAAR